MDGFDTKSQLWLLPDDLVGKRFLDLGCNVGFFVFEAERRGAVAYGLDKQKNQLDKAVAMKQQIGSCATFSRGDISRLTLWEHYPRITKGERGFDVVLSTSVLHHLHCLPSALSAIRGMVEEQFVAEFRCWVPKSKFGKADVIPEDWGDDYHKVSPTPDAVLNALRDRFSRAEMAGPNKNAERIVFRAYV
jgi:SAM-dependent methyltransferase